MHDLLNSTIRRLKTGWFWPLVLLALPNCSLETGGLGPALILNRGPLPHGDAVMCDIEKFQGVTRRCASPQDLALGISLPSAAEALVFGQRSSIGLDFSPAATAACSGLPQAIDFQGSFPDGVAVCINCTAAIPALEADATAVCVAQCQDDINYGEPPKPADPVAFCTANAHPSTNFPKTGCFNGACSDGGTLRPDFADPRRTPEPVVWDDFMPNTTPTGTGNSLMKTAGSNTTFDAGAVSDQWISRGDAYVEAEASENNLSHVFGLALVPGGCTMPAACHDTDPSIADINFAISLNIDGRFYIIEGGSLVAGPDLNQSFGTYNAGERFRVKVTDKHDGTATITYSRVNGACVPGNPCPDTEFYTHVGSAGYPLRVDTSFRELNATLANVTIVRIQ
jgi:hypothetical protein